MIREVLLVVHAVGWLIVVATTAIQLDGKVPAELWMALPLGIGAILGAFRGDSMFGRRDRRDEETK